MNLLHGRRKKRPQDFAGLVRTLCQSRAARKQSRSPIARNRGAFAVSNYNSAQLSLRTHASIEP